MLRAATDQFANATLGDATSKAADEVEGDDAEAMEQDADGTAAPLEQAAPAVRRVGGGDEGDGDGDDASVLCVPGVPCPLRRLGIRDCAQRGLWPQMLRLTRITPRVCHVLACISA